MTVYMFFNYFLAFMFYSFIGWCMEVTIQLIEKKKMINRGFLIGPYLPIYGFGCMLIVSLLKDYTDSPLVLFILAVVICTVLEYITSYLMEVFFKARWWDYSDKKFNINGRVCLETAVPFGIGGTIIMYFIHPFIMNIIESFSNTFLMVFGTIILIIFLIDYSVSLHTMFKIKGVHLKINTDNTEEITKKVKEHLLNHSKLTKRLMKAFPNVHIQLHKHKKDPK